MGGLRELGPLTEDVKVRGKTLTLCGLNVDDLIFLVQAFPDLIAALVENRDDKIEFIKKLGPKIVAHVIACASGERNNESALRVAVKLSASKQLEAVEKIFELTFEDGIGPFLDRLERMNSSLPANENSVSQSDDSWSAELQGDEPRPHVALRRRAA